MNDEILTRLLEASPGFDSGRARQLVRDARLFHDAGGHVVLAACGVGADRTGGIETGLYSAVAELAVGAAPFTIGLTVPDGQSWRVVAASGRLTNGGADSPFTEGRIGILPVLGQHPTAAPATTGGAALVPAAAGIRLPLLATIGAGGGEGWARPVSVVLNAGDTIVWDGAGTVAGDIAQLAIAYRLWTAAAAFPPG